MAVTPYALKTFAYPLLTGFSPFEHVLVYKTTGSAHFSTFLISDGGMINSHQDYTGLSAIDTVLDSLYYKSRDLENKMLVDTFNISRHKLAFLPTPMSRVTMEMLLTKTIHRINHTEEFY